MSMEALVKQEEKQLDEKTPNEESHLLEEDPQMSVENTLAEQEEPEGKRRVGVPKGNLIPVHMYGILRGDYKCKICIKTHDFFNTNRARKHFKYKHVDFLSPKGKKVAEKESFTDMPMIKYLPKGETKWQWVQGFSEDFWEEMMS
jgi:hypothetical protein